MTEDEQVLMMQHLDPELRNLIEVFKRNDSDRSKTDRQMIQCHVLRKIDYFGSTGQKKR